MGGRVLSPFFFGATLSPACSILPSAGLQCYSNQPARFGWVSRKRPPLFLHLQQTRLAKKLQTLSFMPIIGQKISPLSETWDSRWTTTTYLPPKTSQPMMALVRLLGGFSLKGRSGAGMELTREQGLVG